MEFISKIYSHEYFGVGLFIVIGVLAFLFILILILGKLDEKKRKKMEASEKPEVAYKDVPVEPTALEVPIHEEVKEPVIEPIVSSTINVEPIAPIAEEKPQAFNAAFADLDKPLLDDDATIELHIHQDLGEPISFEKEEEIEPIVFERPTMEFEDLEKSLNDEEEKTFEPNFQPFYHEEVEPVPNVEITPMASSESHYKPTMEQFSSVYVQAKPEVSEEVKPTPLPMDFGVELPKPAELPKLAGEEEPEVKALEEKVVDIPGLTMFPDFESETYDLDQK